MNVSVIIPNYNHAAYFKHRIESVLNQTYTDFELILLDDHSTDNSKEIIEQYRDHPKVTQIIYNNENSGNTFKQWEKGVALTKGEYIWIAESDDYADEKFLETAMAKLCNDSSLGLFFCNCSSINAKDNITGSAHDYAIEFLQYFKDGKTMDGKFFCEHYLFFSNIIVNASAVIFKKKLFLSADKTYLHLKISGDWRMWVNICFGTNIFFDERKLNYFRTHPENVRSQKAFLMGAEAIKNQIYFLKKIQDKKVKEKLKNSICKIWVYSFYLNKNFHINALLIKNILLVDGLFPLRLLKRIFAKSLRR